jgi:hypothetical protein
VDDGVRPVYDSSRINEVVALRPVAGAGRNGRGRSFGSAGPGLSCRVPCSALKDCSMSLIETVADDRPEHPVDVVERLAAVNEWTFDRAAEDELSILVAGAWANYDLAFTWLPDLESLHVACSFDLKAPQRKRAAVSELIQLINEQLWLGHFDIWRDQDLVMFRHAICLAGGANASDAQCAAVVKAAIAACETYFQAFQFVLCADRSPREAIAFAAFETRGAA